VYCHVKASMVKDEYTFVPDSYTISFKPNLNYLIRTTDGMVFHLIDNIKKQTVWYFTLEINILNTNRFLNDPYNYNNTMW